MSVSLKFHCQSGDGSTLELSKTIIDSFLTVEIQRESEYLIVQFDKSTAIKFSKELRKQIALLD